MMFTRLALSAALVGAALVGAAAAQFRIIAPGADVWWVAKSQNTLTWTCNENPPHQTFTVLVGNKDVKVLTAPIAIIGIQNNFDCSKLITQNQITAPAGTGYTIQFANTLNQSDVFATSQEFEIKALGSAYPTTTPGLTPSSSGSPSGTGTTAGANSSGSPNGALSTANALTALYGLGLGLGMGVVAGWMGTVL